MKLFILNLIIFLFLIFSGCSKQSANFYSADIIIYGGTSAAITSAVEAVRNGNSVIVVSPDIHPGGLSASGLGWSDTGNKGAIGGLSREFYQRIYQKYDTEKAWRWELKSEYGNVGQGTPAIDGDKRTMWIFEPHVAEEVFEDFISEYKIKMFRDEWLNRENGVVVDNGRIQSFKTLSGKTFSGKIFIDATYEGDLMAAAGVSYHVGRESTDTYGEKWNGVQTGVYHHQHWFYSDISAYNIPGDPE